jgi:hypothetical protein
VFFVLRKSEFYIETSKHFIIIIIIIIIIRLNINAEKTKYMFMSGQHNAAGYHKLKRAINYLKMGEIWSL